MGTENSTDKLPVDEKSVHIDSVERPEPNNSLGSKFKHRRAALIVLAVSVVLVAGGLTGYFLIIDKEEVNIAETTGPLPCTDESISTSLKDTSNALNPATPEKVNELNAIADRIMSYENYQNDIHCLQILTIKYLTFGDYEKAKTNLESLEKLLEQKGITTIPQIDYLWKIEDLRRGVEYSSKKAEEIEKNNPYKTERRKADGTVLPEDRTE